MVLLFKLLLMLLSENAHSLLNSSCCCYVIQEMNLLALLNPTPHDISALASATARVRSWGTNVVKRRQTSTKIKIKFCVEWGRRRQLCDAVKTCLCSCFVLWQYFLCDVTFLWRFCDVCFKTKTLTSLLFCSNGLRGHVLVVLGRQSNLERRIWSVDVRRNAESDVILLRLQRYRAFHGFGQAKFPNGGSVLGLSQF